MSDRSVSTRFRLREGEKQHPLTEGEVVLGRGADSDIVVDDRSASRKHARLTIGQGVEIEDLGSINGVLVNNVAITRKTALGHGDRIGIASVTFVLVDTQQRGHQTRPGRTLVSPVPMRPEVSLDELEAAVGRGDGPLAAHLATLACEQVGRRPTELPRLERTLLSLGERDPLWLERILELRGAAGEVPEGSTVTRLHELARAGRPIREEAIRSYLKALTPRHETLSTSARFVYRRLEALLRTKPDV